MVTAIAAGPAEPGDTWTLIWETAVRLSDEAMDALRSYSDDVIHVTSATIRRASIAVSGEIGAAERYLVEVGGTFETAVSDGYRAAVRVMDWTSGYGAYGRIQSYVQSRLEDATSGLGDWWSGGWSGIWSRLATVAWWVWLALAALVWVYARGRA